MPKVGMQPIRRQQLIDATLEAINELGLAEASISQIAKRAGVSTGIISHYFKDKHGLIFATMQYLLAQLETAVAQALSQTEASPKTRLMAIVRGNFSPSQINQAAMKTWLAFWSVSLYQPDLHELQQVNEQWLYSSLKHEFCKCLDEKQAEDAALGLAALIDGFWLRGALSQTPLRIDETIRICEQYIDHKLAY